MSYLNRSIAGLTGALVLTAVHQIFKKNTKGAPNLDQIGEKAIETSLEKVDLNSTNEDEVYSAAMSGNILSNAVLFSTLATTTNTSQLLSKTLGTGLLGAAASFGLADELLGNNTATNTSQKKWMTTGYYLLGALVSMGVYNLLEKKINK